MGALALAVLASGFVLGFLPMNGGDTDRLSDGLGCGSPFLPGNDDLSDTGEVFCELEAGRANRRAYSISLLLGGLVLGFAAMMVGIPPDDPASRPK